ncbi:EAL domain-containing response regulator [Vibrio clamense]|uniref:EAL domain-containing response regulator n=1 Tax=Vibrio TaxID=662 RepID=UPI000DE99353|nr:MULTISPECIES: EAL domain-containing response regulator [Vibrio]MDN3698603.1 EAL domain-containing response regulator [Vibrio cortegadensis]NOH83238.1 EAL domain-containing protein [Vibrio sp. 03-59-1]RBW66521.1 diguanylate phosphodiesterase [Vibrionales bacterium C3R12]TKF23765.1 EAL domain-containing protein [Vibrio genomosp. F6]
MSKRILVIEDHNFQRMALLALLKQFDHVEAEGVGSAQEALDLIEIQTPDMVICDLNMPGIDGITLLRLLAEADYGGEVIISSAVTEVVLKAAGRMCTAYNMNLLGAISKPINKVKLDAILNQNLKPKHYFSKPLPDFSREDILEALDKEQFIPFYQPLIKFETGEWLESEALVRWDHPEHGLLSPIFFVEKIIKYGLSTKLTLLLLKCALRDLPTLGNRRVAINITAQDLMDASFVDTVLALQVEHPSLPQRLRFELTETDMIEHLGYTLSSAIRLCMKGFELAIDDFGTGYSSMQLLDDMPFTELKIDLSFVQKMLVSRSAESIVAASLFLAKKLGMETVSEGIETREVWMHLRSITDGMGQGYFMSRPLPLHELEQWHQDWQVRVKDEDLLSGPFACKMGKC